jgi:hypothetical protein
MAVQSATPDAPFAVPARRYELRRDDSRNDACVEVAVSAVVSIVLGLLGGIGLERLRNAQRLRGTPGCLQAAACPR